MSLYTWTDDSGIFDPEQSAKELELLEADHLEMSGEIPPQL